VNAVVEFFNIHDDSIADNQGCEDVVRSDAVSCFCVKIGWKLLGFCRGEVAISPFVVDVPSSSQSVRFCS